MPIHVKENDRTEPFTVEQLAQQAPVHVPLEERVPRTVGTAFELLGWYQRWTRDSSPATHLQVMAEDEFAATIPWSELERAVFLYEQDGAPLTKGFPLRLYVPDGSSACLNVKSVVHIEFLHLSDPDRQAEFGFRNRITPEQLRKKG